ncbi:tripartite tricarboxylate transporter TctB family protein [Radiobacillus kanasensis]|uniref:tripartite tricarboxylate transporter TctB family protein n=1 Tax=Radiobacillus kanasensis TaxID=2844358 RepID=UPI001E47E7CF|nr:tripartite tricarboxylate transporter TctB family protein [Radiobacillus kanasensis]UFU00793.1 tripartite tricarboxylate transporter TctB family protein [Radiobacillus kanasensis]
MKILKLTMPVLLLILGSSFLIFSFQIEKSNLGNPNGPLYFPVGLSILLLLFSVIYFIQEWKKRHEDDKVLSLLLAGRTPKLIGVTVLLGVGYSLLFERIGFLFSTILFLGALLFVLNGKKKWITNLVVAICFSFLSWYAFSELLGVSLP